jgi:glucosamine--fructose-6-phosphate aminotransferase (isomerizing)
MAEDMDKGKFPHFMLKEIYEQPNSVRDAMRGRLSIEEATAKLGGLEMSNAELRQIERIVLSGCGTAFHAAMVENISSNHSPTFRLSANSPANCAIATFP